MESKNVILRKNDLRQSHTVDVDPELVGKLPADGGTPPPGITTGRFQASERHESLSPKAEPTIVQTLATRSVFSAKEVEDAFSYLTDHMPHIRPKINLTVHQGVDVVEAAIKIAQVAGTTINTQVENILRILEAQA